MAVPQYRPVADAQALKILLRNPDIPDPRLMVGYAEALTPLPVLIYQDVVPPESKAIMAIYDSIPIEQAAEKLEGTSLTVDDFAGEMMFFGNATETY